MDLLSKLSSNIVVRCVKNERGMERCCLPGIAVISRGSQGIAVSNFFTRASGLATVLRRENVDTTATTVAGSRLHVCGERRNKPRESFLIMVSQFASSWMGCWFNGRPDASRLADPCRRCASFPHHLLLWLLQYSTTDIISLESLQNMVNVRTLFE